MGQTPDSFSAAWGVQGFAFQKSEAFYFGIFILVV